MTTVEKVSSVIAWLLLAALLCVLALGGVTLLPVLVNPKWGSVIWWAQSMFEVMGFTLVGGGFVALFQRIREVYNNWNS